MIKILIIEKQTIVAEGLRVLLEEETNFQVFVTNNRDIKLANFSDLKIDIVLISLENMDESDFAYLNIFYKLNIDSDKSQFFYPLKLIVYAEKVDETILSKALKLDCKGYLLKDSSIEELKQAIISVNNGYKHIGNSVFTKIDHLSVKYQSPNLILENDLINSQEYLNTSLVIRENNESDYQKINLSNQEIKVRAVKNILPDKLPPSPEYQNKSIVSLFSKQAQFKKYTSFRSISSSILLVSWGCLAGITGIFLVRNRIEKSFSPIVKSGTVEGEIVTIKNTASGKIKLLHYEVGDLVESNAIVAEIESQSNQEKPKIIQEVINQIQKINNHIEHQQELQAINQLDLTRDRKKLEELLTENITLEQNTIFEQEELTFAAQPNLQAIQKEVEVAYSNYDRLLKLKEQNVTSIQEVENAKLNWLTAQNKLTKIKNNSQTQNSADLLHIENQREIDKQKYLQYIQENIKKWLTQIRERENTIKLLEQDLNEAKEHLNILYDSYREQQLIEVKAPVKGVISQININNNQVSNEDQTFIQLVDCNNLWVEVYVDANVLEKINIQQPVLLNWGTSNLHLYSKISSIYPVSNYDELYPKTHSTQIPNSKNNSNENSLDNISWFKIKVDFPIPDKYAEEIMFCGWKGTANIVFNN